jgi:osmoprotectant transport system ATP-binding protein
MDEAIKLADKIAVMQSGNIMQYGSPEKILLHPANDFVENFVGKDRLWRQPDLMSAKDIMQENFPRVNLNRTPVKAIEILKAFALDFMCES